MFILKNITLSKYIKKDKKQAILLKKFSLESKFLWNINELYKLKIILLTFLARKKPKIRVLQKRTTMKYFITQLLNKKPTKTLKKLIQKLKQTDNLKINYLFTGKFSQVLVLKWPNCVTKTFDFITDCFNLEFNIFTLFITLIFKTKSANQIYFFLDTLNFKKNS